MRSPSINDSFRTQWSLSPLDTGYSGSLHPNPRGYAKMAEAAYSAAYPIARVATDAAAALPASAP